AIVDKMVVGRINKYYKDVCLLEQAFVKDGDKAVKNILDGTISSFVRFEMGEGLEKKSEDLASEVQAQIDAQKK
ncbi:MAG TPA: elongation factor Ts, partial [Clostridia bacterium]|nr:elongation factor Ts [Clostridia bacterium]